MQSKILALVKYFHLSDANWYGARRTCPEDEWSVLPASARTELDAGLNQSCSDGRGTDAARGADRGNALACPVSLCKDIGIEAGRCLAGPALRLQFDVRSEQPSAGGLECNAEFIRERAVIVPDRR